MGYGGIFGLGFFFLVLVLQELAVYFGFLLKGAWAICLVGKRVSPGPRLWAMAWEAGLQMETNERSGRLARGCCVHCVLSKPSLRSCLGWEIQNRTGRWADSQKGDRGAGGEGVGVVSPHRLLVAHSPSLEATPESSWCEMWTGHWGVHLRSQHRHCGPAEPGWQL